MDPKNAPSGLDVSVGVLGQMVEYLEDHGVDIGRLFASVGSDIGLLDDPDARIDAEAYLALEEKGAEMAGDEYLGLHMGEYVKPGSWSVAGHFMAQCDTLGQVFVKGGRYARVIGNLISSKAWLIPGGVRVQLAAPRHAPTMSRHCWDSVLASSITMARRLTGKPLAPLAVRLPGGKPADPEEYERIFRCPVRFESKNAGMDIPLSMIEEKVLSPDPALAARFEAWAEECLARLPPLKLTGSRVAKRILERLDDGSISIRSVARDLGMSPRSLQLDLAAEGCDFSGILRRTREGLARRFLKEGRGAEEIACLLGFSEASAFHRAFRKWTGLTPAECRRSG